MPRSDEPVDLLINLDPVSGDEVGIFMEEQGAGQAGTKLEAMRLEEVASSYGFLQQGGAGVFEFAQLGQKLFGDLFAGAHQRRIYLRASDTAEREDRPLRILVRLPHDSPLSRLPWELLHDGERFLAKDPRCSVVRYFYGGRVQPFQVDPPLRVLLTSACPRSQPPLHLETEIRAVTAAYYPAGKAVDLRVVPGISLGRLERLWNEAELARKPFHVWHHCGHGHLSTRGETPRFFLSLEEDGEAQYASTEQLSEIVGMCPGLRLAVLNVCHGGSFAGLAPELAKLNIPVVIGFPSRVANDTAYRFAATFHQNLLHIPVELAVSQARRSLSVYRSSDLDWSRPLLFSRRKDSGPILRALSPEPSVVNSGADQRRPGGVRFHVGSIEADEVINAGYAGDAPPPAELPQLDVSFTQDSVKARSIKSFGFLVTKGFSSEDLVRREQQMAELLKEIDADRVTEAHRD
jgi:hypothetical protein